MMKTVVSLITAVLLAAILMSGCSSNPNKALEEELTLLRSELEQTKSSLAEQQKINEELKNRQDAAKEYTDLYQQPLDPAYASAGGLSYLENAPADLDASYPIAEPIERINQVKEYLGSFVKLTEKSRRYLSDAELREIGSTGWEIQALAFANVPLRIEGALREQNIIIKKLDLGLAIKMYQLGEIEIDVLRERAEDFKTARSEYLNFAKNSFIAD